MRYHELVAIEEGDATDEVGEVGAVGEEARAARARARAAWTGHVCRLSELPEVEVLDLPPAVLFGLVRELTLEAWALGGAAMPSYARSAIPGRVLRPGER